MINLLDAMDTIQQKKLLLKRETEEKIKAFDEAYLVLWNINEACPHCKGKGKKLRSRSCAEDYRPDPNDPSDWETCKLCGGSGRKCDGGN